MLSGIKDFIGLDIGTTALRLVQLQGSGAVKSLVRYAEMGLDEKTAVSEADADKQKLANSIKQLMTEAKIMTRNVAVGLPSQKVFTTLVDIERLSPEETAKAIRLQADSIIPTPLSESKIDWAIVGDSPADAGKVEVLLTSVTNDYIEQRLELIESLGLNVIAFEPDNLALTRSLLPAESSETTLLLDIGYKTTDLVIVVAGIPKLTRSIPTGSEAFIKAAVQNLNIDTSQASQFVFKFGLSKDKLEGQIYQAIIGTVESLLSEVEKSMKFITTRYTDRKIDRIIVAGAASILPDFPIFVANKFNVNVEIGNPWRNVAFPPQQQNELLGVANHFSVAVGLAERIE